MQAGWAEGRGGGTPSARHPLRAPSTAPPVPSLQVPALLADAAVGSSERDKWGQRQWGHCNFHVFWQRDFLGTPVNLLLFVQKCQGVPFSPVCPRIHHYLCSGPISADPICPPPRLPVGRGPGRLAGQQYLKDGRQMRPRELCLIRRPSFRGCGI